MEDHPRKGKPQHELAQEMNQLVAELSAMARQVGAQLDARAARLERLIKQADERIAELTQLSSQAAPAKQRAAKPGAAKEGSEGLVAARYQEVYELADAGKDIAQIAEKLGRPSGEIELILALRAHSAVNDSSRVE